MMKSMTGYGNATQQNKQWNLDVSIKSVNGRFLEIKFHMPQQYSALESELRSLVQKKIRRGTVNVYINRKQGTEGSAFSAVVQTGLAKQWLKAYKKLGKDLGLPGKPDLDTIVRQPDIIRIEPNKTVSATEKSALLANTTKALNSCNKERDREGRAIAKELEKHLKELESLTGKINTLRDKANKELSLKLKKRLKSHGLEGTVEDSRLAQEIIIAIDKADITEELNRLKEHISAFRTEVRSPNAQGKKLDFYSQELLRETNTIGAKSPLTKLTQAVVEAKAIIERVKEQVQNIE